MEATDLPCCYCKEYVSGMAFGVQGNWLHSWR